MITCKRTYNKDIHNISHIIQSIIQLLPFNKFKSPIPYYYYMKYSTLKFRTYNSKDREGFVLIFNLIPPQILLQDILFQLFYPLYPKIKAPEIYYFTESEQILTYNQLTASQNFIYIHFLERNVNLHQDSVEKPFFLVDIEMMARGLDKRHNDILYIFSQKQYLAYKNKKYCEIVRSRIEDWGRSTIQKKMSNITFIKKIKDFMREEDIKEIIKKSLIEESKRLDQKEEEMIALTKTLLKVKNQVEESLNLVRISLKSVFD